LKNDGNGAKKESTKRRGRIGPDKGVGKEKTREGRPERAGETPMSISNGWNHLGK